MRFSALTSLLAWGAFAGVLATPTKVSWAPSLVERDFAAVTSVVAAISSKVDTLDANIKAYTGGDTSAIVDASADLISTINDGTSTVAAQPALSQVDALNLVNPILALTNKVKTTIDDLISKKSLIVEAGAGPTTYSQLLDQYTASSNLATTLSGKVPEALKQVAEELSSGITSAIQKGIDAYKDTSTPCETTTTPTETSTPCETTTTPTETSTPCETTTTPPETSTPCETTTTTTPPTETTTTPTTPPAETTTTTNVPVPPVTSTTTATETTPCHECEGTTSVPNPPGPTTLTTVPACTTCGGSGGGGGGEQPTPPVVVPQPSPSSPTTIAPPGGLSTGAASKLGSSLGTAMAIAAFALLLHNFPCTYMNLGKLKSKNRMYLTTLALTALIAITAADKTFPTVIMKMRNGLTVLSGSPGNCLTYTVHHPIETVQINTPCRFYDEIECAGNATNYSPETEIPVADVAEMGSVRCGEEADLEKS
ncbi:hypothetical protein KXW42_003471 [Aspergillus fumigatus]|nr:hypothetical protein KXX10_001856 [Aspergillus fumigatus]KAH2854801.1 hypothetical protein KXW36_002382 [Aspergillus fumigatus]KAH3186713.1 hypothetical protein KXW84_008825 [Aspergillus fumigatus]KAH3388900.1 hypothetical protein KXW42_003471 [Aspergillus fumigatus]KAH3394310.1 hypothetical protein KXW79_001902 [Aspergillus fumigatus]